MIPYILQGTVVAVIFQCYVVIDHDLSMIISRIEHREHKNMNEMACIYLILYHLLLAIQQQAQQQQ